MCRAGRRGLRTATAANGCFSLSPSDNLSAYAMAKRKRRDLPSADVAELGTRLSVRERSTGAGGRGPSGSAVCQQVHRRHNGNADHQPRLATEDLDAVLVARRVEYPHPHSPPAGRCGHGHPESWQQLLVLSAESESHGEDSGIYDDDLVDGQ